MPHIFSMLNVSLLKGENSLVSARDGGGVCVCVQAYMCQVKISDYKLKNARNVNFFIFSTIKFHFYFKAHFPRDRKFDPDQFKFQSPNEPLNYLNFNRFL